MLGDRRRDRWQIEHLAADLTGHGGAGHGQKAVAKDLKGARYALWKNPEDLTERQAAKLASIAKTNRPLYRAYLLKEQLRQVFSLKGAAGIALLERWLQWARRSRLPSFVKLAKAITDHRPEIEAALTHGLSNARVESVNTKLRLLTRIAFGFRSPDALIALAMLDLGCLWPTSTRPHSRMNPPTDWGEEPVMFDASLVISRSKVGVATDVLDRPTRFHVAAGRDLDGTLLDCVAFRVCSGGSPAALAPRREMAFPAASLAAYAERAEPWAGLSIRSSTS